MFVHISWKTKVKPKRDGIEVTTKCEKCGETTTFFECEEEKDVKLFGLVNLWDTKSTVMQCGACHENFKVNMWSDPQIKEAFDARQRKQDEEHAAEEEKQRAEEERKRQEEDAKRRKEREEEEKRKEAAVDAELEQLKKKMGK